MHLLNRFTNVLTKSYHSVRSVLLILHANNKMKWRVASSFLSNVSLMVVCLFLKDIVRNLKKAEIDGQV
jgi:hypothetical protein